MKKTLLLKTFGLILLSVSTLPLAHADGSIVCTSVVLEAAPPIVMDRAAQPTGTVAELRLREGQITPLPSRSSGMMAFTFDSGIVHLTSRNGLSDKRIHGVLEVNLHDPERSILKSQTLSRVCEGINVFGHCSGNWEILQSDVQPVNSLMSCAIH